mgnify:CR=1 FL=1
MKTQTDPEGSPATSPSRDDPAVRPFPDECAHHSFYKSIMDSLPMAVVTMDSDFRITGFNPWAEKLTGYRTEEAVGRICQEILSSTLCGGSCPLKAVQNPETRSVTSKAEITDRDGSSKPVRISAAALFDSEGRRMGGVEAIMDLTSIGGLGFGGGRGDRNRARGPAFHLRYLPPGQRHWRSGRARPRTGDREGHRGEPRRSGPGGH